MLQPIRESIISPLDLKYIQTFTSSALVEMIIQCIAHETQQAFQFVVVCDYSVWTSKGYLATRIGSWVIEDSSYVV